MADFSLSAGSDTINGTAQSDTVYATAATLNASDSLNGGAGIDVLALYGSGIVHVDQLAAFSGFESITLNCFSSPAGGITLYLGNQPIAVTGTGSGGEFVYLGSGATTFHGGDGANTVY